MGIESQPFMCLLMLCFLLINTNKLHHFGEHDYQHAVNFSFAEKGKWFQQLRNQIVNSDYFHEFSCPETIGLSLEISFGNTFFAADFLVMYLKYFLADWSNQVLTNLLQCFLKWTFGNMLLYLTLLIIQLSIYVMLSKKLSIYEHRSQSSTKMAFDNFRVS